MVMSVNVHERKYSASRDCAHKYCTSRGSLNIGVLSLLGYIYSQMERLEWRALNSRADVR